MSAGRVEGVFASAQRGLSKAARPAIELVAGLGVAGDVHAGARVQHRSRIARDPSQPNLRQVHLFPGEVLDALAAQGFQLAPGDLGQNLTTRGVPLLELPRGTLLRVGGEALVALSGLRNPCAQLEDHRPGLLAALAGKDAHGQLVRRAGVMATVLSGGRVQVGDPIALALPPPPHQPLLRV